MGTNHPRNQGSMNHIKELKGQSIAKKLLTNYLASYPPALMIFHGPHGVGKWSAAEALIRQFLCTGRNGCGLCPPCRKLASNQHADYIRFPESSVPIGDPNAPEAFSIRWLQKTRISYTPFDGRIRFVLFPRGDRIQNEAETALLKIFEETPDHTRFIILTPSLSDLKPTIVSRGICVPFSLLPKESVSDITSITGARELDLLGGSMEKVLMIRSNYYKLLMTKLPEALQHPLDLMNLEKWLYRLENPETASKEIQMKQDYTQILNFFCLVLLSYSRQHKSHKEILQAVFELKEDLLEEMQGIYPYLLGRLFASLHSILFV